MDSHGMQFLNLFINCKKFEITNMSFWKSEKQESENCKNCKNILSGISRKNVQLHFIHSPWHWKLKKFKLSFQFIENSALVGNKKMTMLKKCLKILFFKWHFVKIFQQIQTVFFDSWTFLLVKIKLLKWTRLNVNI